jgi:hypothetical protein
VQCSYFFSRNKVAHYPTETLKSLSESCRGGKFPARNGQRPPSSFVEIYYFRLTGRLGGSADSFFLLLPHYDECEFCRQICNIQTTMSWLSCIKMCDYNCLIRLNRIRKDCAILCIVIQACFVSRVRKTCTPWLSCNSPFTAQKESPVKIRHDGTFITPIILRADYFINTNFFIAENL